MRVPFRPNGTLTVFVCIHEKKKIKQDFIVLFALNTRKRLAGVQQWAVSIVVGKNIKSIVDTASWKLQQRRGKPPSPPVVQIEKIRVLAENLPRCLTKRLKSLYTTYAWGDRNRGKWTENVTSRRRAGHVSKWKSREAGPLIHTNAFKRQWAQDETMASYDI